MLYPATEAIPAMATKSKGSTMMPAKAVRNDGLMTHDYVFADGWTVEVDRSEEYPEQLKIAVRSPSFDVVSEMLVWVK